jgi:isocitrate dehydrogenase (NAD+)
MITCSELAESFKLFQTSQSEHIWLPEPSELLTAAQGLYTVSLIEGDGIGPEISQSVKDIFAAAKVNRSPFVRRLC